MGVELSFGLDRQVFSLRVLYGTMRVGIVEDQTLPALDI